ncbi:MAG: hypothetical protein DI551_02545 [Micavibrio aeruginosavorus]|uniref:Uncharacterized protein n=1 Tax=Micavibrio aeruginosavorus TaxID=349221 RepID=A0A2W5Q8Z6_9BACT|nr:MAG: hypothetical protein DI551_02545 [Micavibrio aeruginosavorus]
MVASKIDQIKEDIYESFRNDNEGLDEAIAALKVELKAQGTKEATFETVKLVQNNRQGRQMMKSYFKKRGVVVKFDKSGEGEAG